MDKKIFKFHEKCIRISPSKTRAEEAHQISKLRPSQSPIAISLDKLPKWNSLDPLKFENYWNNPSKATLLNNGLSAFFTFDGDNVPRLSGGPLVGEYIFAQMHFHWSVDGYTGCEHVLDGRGFAAEAHLVHFNSKYSSVEEAVTFSDGLAVIGFILESVDAPNPLFDELVHGLDAIKTFNSSASVSAQCLAWMEEEKLCESPYVTYKGSLTTPPFNEAVTWIVFEKTIKIGSEQINLFRQLESENQQKIERNVRQTQRQPPGLSVIYVQQHKAKL